MTHDDDPLSPRNVGAHVIVLLLLLLAGCVIEWAKQRYHPSFLTLVLIGMGEIVILIYMIGSIAQAVRWTYYQWRGTSINEEWQTRSLKDFLPKKKNVKRALKLRGPLRFILISLFIITAILLTEINIIIIDLPTDSAWPPLHRIPLKTWLAAVKWLNEKSLTIGLIISAIAVVTITSVFTTAVLKRRRYETI